VPAANDAFIVQFDDNSTNETGFILQVAEDPDFFDVDDVFLAEGRESFLVRDISLPAGDGTGIYSFRYELPAGAEANAERAFRVRAYNTQGNTAFAGRAVERTLGADLEVLLDDADPQRIQIDSLTGVIAPTNNVGIGYSTFSTSFDITPFSGLDFVDNTIVGGFNVLFGPGSVTTASGRTLVEIFADGTTVAESRIVDSSSFGGEVLIGTADLQEDAFIRITPLDDESTFDSLRLLPA
jgi:hypothetical protein